MAQRLGAGLCVRLGTCLFAALAGLISAGGVRAQAPGVSSAVTVRTCDRTCLIGLLHSYLDALAHHDPARAPLDPKLRFTENDVVLAPGRGLWGSISAVAPTGLEVADPDTGNAAWFGTVQEHGEPAYYAMRLKAEGGRITEVETVVTRKGGLPAPFGDPSTLQHDSAFSEVLPADQRRERERLIAVAEGYFNTVEQNDGQVFTAFDPECGRTENGISTTAGGVGAAAIAQGCEAQFKLGIYRINKRVRERRFPIVDVERGVVVATGFFDHANRFDSYQTTDGKTMRTALKWPNSITLMEAFRIRAGHIHRIEAVFTYVPYFMHSPWAEPPASAAGSGGIQPIVSIAGPGPDSVAAPGAAPALHGACDQACLEQAAAGYMDALAAQDPSRVRWAKTVRYTENSVSMMIGDGVWGTATAHSANPLVVADPASGNVAWYGTLAEHGQAAYYAMRLKVEDGAVAEVEAVIQRKGAAEPFGDPSAYTHDPLFSQPLAPAERVSRKRLIELANGYFDTVQRNDGTLHTKFDPDCARNENGVVTTNGSYTTTAQGCEAPFRLGVFRFVDQARARRFPVVDEAHGVVVAAAYFDHGASFDEYQTTDGKLAHNPIKHPTTIGLLEAFKIRNGRIVRVEAVFTSVPFGMASQWGGTTR